MALPKMLFGMIRHVWTNIQILTYLYDRGPCNYR